MPVRVSLPEVRITHGMPSGCPARLRALLGAALGADEKAAEKELQQLEGTWTVEGGRVVRTWVWTRTWA